ncbi:MAG: hypothetical protein GY906_40290 [bacterium]|nr:hypothetical protein [bacterium]
MPRKPRLFVPGAIYHVYCRTARGELVFVDDTEAEEFIEVVKEVRDLDEMTILVYKGHCLTLVGIDWVRVYRSKKLSNQAFNTMGAGGATVRRD